MAAAPVVEGRVAVAGVALEEVAMAAEAAEALEGAATAAEATEAAVVAVRAVEARAVEELAAAGSEASGRDVNEAPPACAGRPGLSPGLVYQAAPPPSSAAVARRADVLRLLPASARSGTTALPC